MNKMQTTIFQYRILALAKFYNRLQFLIFRYIQIQVFRLFIDLSDFIPSEGKIGKVASFSIIKKLKDSLDIDYKTSKKLLENNIKEIELKKGITIGETPDYTGILKDLNQHIISYQSLVVSSFKMIKSLNEDDMITFYEVYEIFDKLGIFDTQWQKSMLEKLGDLTSSIEDVSTSLKNVNTSIKNELDNLSEDLIGVSMEISSGFDLISFDLNNM